MSQLKKKVPKEEANQPYINQFINTPPTLPCVSDTEEYISKSAGPYSHKRKKTSSPNSSQKTTSKRINLFEKEPMTKMAETEQKGSEPLTLQAVKDLLKPLNERISKVLTASRRNEQCYRRCYNTETRE